jgi:hypothetical protein
MEEISVFRRVAPRLGFVAALPLFLAAFAPMAYAQTNIDQGKSPSEIFANDCAVCHKTTRGLAAGKNSLMLSGFLREHYTASRDQAAALAAYVLGAGGGSGPPPPPPSQKPGTDRTRAAVEEPKSGEPGTSEPRIAEPKTSEPKTSEPKTSEPKTSEPKREPKTAARPAHPSAKPEEEVRPVTASRGHKLEPEPAIPPQEPAAVVAVPAVSETPRSAEAPSQDANPVANVPTTSAAAPAESQPSDSEPVPRDDIPD